MSETTVADPTIAALVPDRSRVRDAALVGVALVVLIALWVSPTVLRPSLGAASWVNGAVGPGVLSMTTLEPHAVGGLVVQSVEDAPGATAVGAWLVTPGGSGNDSADAWLDAIQETSPGADAAALPAHLDADDGETQLAIAWRIDDCDALVQGFEPTVHLSTVLHTPARVTLPDMAGPSFDVALIRDAGLC